MGRPRYWGFILAVLIWPAAVTSVPRFDGPFAGCGEFIQGVECILFQADSGGLYLTDGTYGYSVGDRVHITGTLWECTSICMQEDACLEVESMGLCGVPQQRSSWGAIKSLYRTERR